VLAYLRDNHRALVPPAWDMNKKLASDTITKVRRKMGIPPKKAVKPTLIRH